MKLRFQKLINALSSLNRTNPVDYEISEEQVNNDPLIKEQMEQMKKFMSWSLKQQEYKTWDQLKLFLAKSMKENPFVSKTLDLPFIQDFLNVQRDCGGSDLTIGVDAHGYGGTLHDYSKGGLSKLYDQLMEAYTNA